MRALLTGTLLSLAPLLARAQSTQPAASTALPQPGLIWYLFATAIALLVPVGVILLGVAGLDPVRAWNSALGAVGAIGISAVAYWAVGFALQFGGVGLAYSHPGLRALVWEWSPLPAEWGMGWGAAGLSGWFLSGSDTTAMTYALFASHLPWVFTAALIPVVALRGRAPVIATMLLALFLGGVIYPVAGNWVQGGGWLAALGRNLGMGHGFVDAGGAGTVFLLTAAFSVVALSVWAPRRETGAPGAIRLPPTYQPLLTVAGSLLLLAGLIGWLWSNPLQVETLSELAILRGSVNLVLAAAGGVLIPLFYTWFVSGESDPTMTGRGLAAGAVAGLAIAPFTHPGLAFLTGALAGATVPFMTFLLDHLLRLDDATGAVTVGGLPSLIGLFAVGVVADGMGGAGWQGVGAANYLGIAGQGVTGLLVASGYQLDFPGQLQAQLAGSLSLLLWGGLMGIVICLPLGLLFYGLQRAEASVSINPLAEPGRRERVDPEI
jgi:Amt family ammonium transporter